MAFIEKKDYTTLNVKLTSKGRDLLSQGKLNFKYFGLGDSEIDYIYFDNVGEYKPHILTPFDKNPNILSYVYSGSTTGETLVHIDSNNPKQYISKSSINNIGFFSGSTILTDSSHVKQSNILINIDEVNGGTNLNLYKSSNYVESSPEPELNDILLVKWINKRGDNIDNEIIGNPTPYLFYKIIGIVSGSLSGDSLVVELDRELPNFSNVVGNTGKTAGALIYYDNNSLNKFNPIEYVSKNVIEFIDNFQCDTIKFPYWNMSIIYTEEIAGVSVTNVKYKSFYSNVLTGFLSYIQEQSPQYKKIGVIHYTNSSPDNTYGEGFYHNTAKLFIPTIMWYKSNKTELGLRLSGGTIQKRLNGVNITYYDLVDESGYVVGKIFDGLKLFIIEDQELLFAMSYKSNRNWTLPKINVNIGGSNNFCVTTTTI